MNLNDEFLWTEKYRPQTVEDCILPDRIKSIFEGYAEKPESLTHLILAGQPGIGKTTIAKALARDLGADILFLNASNERGLDVIRNQIAQFAGTVSMFGDGQRKIILLDESDGLPRMTQEALRGVFEEFASNAVFILTCNFKNKLIDPIHSRCSVIDFKLTKEDRQNVARQFMSRMRSILKAENVEYDPAVLAELIKKYMPDWRKCLNDLQKFSVSGNLSNDVLKNLSEESFNELIAYMKDKNFTKVRSWVTENNDIGTDTLFRQFYDSASKLVEPASIPLLVVTLARYQYQASQVADHEINTSACMAELMVDLSWK